MKKILTLSLGLFLARVILHAQAVSINTDGSAPDASAILDVNSTDKGVLVPRMTAAQRSAIASPAAGLLVFDTTTGGFWFFNGTGWQNLSGANTLADADSDTKIQVEASPDEDVIRFDVGGTEEMVLRKNVNGSARLDLPNPLANVFIGKDAGASNLNGEQNAALGQEALYSNTDGYYNTAMGVDALFSNGAGNSNTALGRYALFSNTSGSSNVGIGIQALRYNTDRSFLVAIGDSALYNNGTDASEDFHAIANTAVGSKALFSNTTGGFNTATGFEALFSNTTAGFNTAAGLRALYSNLTGFQNTATGMYALYYNTMGNNNTAIGYLTLSSNTTGTDNTGLGFRADVASSNLSNATAVGNTAAVNASNKVRIGNTSVSVIEGQVDWTFPSDARFKYNVRDDAVPGLAFIEKLRPVTYQFDARKFDEHLMQHLPDSVRQRRMAEQDYARSSATVQTGFLAQEVEAVCKRLDYSFSGLHVPQSEVDNYGLAYGSFVPLLVKAVQEQQAEIEQLKRRDAEYAALKTQLEKITAALQQAGISLN